MITIVEGPDCAGKTTLIRELRDRLHPEPTILHQGPYEGDPMLETIKTLRHFLQVDVIDAPRDLHVICDRLHLGERVYGPTYRGVDKLGAVGQRMTERAILGLGHACVIWCLPPYEVVETEWLKRRDREMLDDTHQLRAVYHGFLMLDTQLPAITYDYTRDTVDQLIGVWSDLHSPANRGPGVGCWRPGEVVLVVGERCNPDHPETDLPFVGTRGCSPWLARQLEDDAVPERSLYWVNARRPDGTEESPGFVHELDPRGIVALGAVAGEWTERFRLDQGRAYTRLDHPQYHKRFFHNDPYPLSEVIHEFLRG